MTPYEALVAPFQEFAFMRRALAGCVAITFGCAPIGVFVMLRRMSLIGGAIAHAVLPGVAIGFLIAGLSLAAMAAGGVVAGLAVALLAGVVARSTPLAEDASLAAFHLIALAAGVLLVSTRGSNVDLIHVLFGSVLALDDAALYLTATIASASLATLAIVYRGLIADCFDPGFLQAVQGRGSVIHLVFLTLVVLNLVAGFQALGTLMVVGILILPAAAARFCAGEVPSLMAVAIFFGLISSVAGLLVSYHFDAPSGPAVILVAGVLYGGAIILGPHAGLIQRWRRPAHLEA